MRVRYKSPTGTGIIELPDDTTIRALREEVKLRTGLQSFGIKYGPPMAMKTLDLDRPMVLAKSIGLHGETLTVFAQAGREALPTDMLKPSEQSAATAQGHMHTQDIDGIAIPWGEREGTLLLRVMPSDNNCLFTSMGGALPEQVPATMLRKMMADYIAKNLDVYTEAVLGSTPENYCRRIQDPDRWGGGIELSILSTIFDIQISTYDVQTQTLINFGENKRNRCILVYSGIHYDRVAFSYSDPPFTSTNLPPEMDRTIWGTDDLEVLAKAKELVGRLNEAHYYTDTEGLVLRCDVPGCDWIGNGEHEALIHAENTGHTALSEIRDDEEDNILRACKAPDCNFMGQGVRAVTRHQHDTGHVSFSIIPDS